MMKHPSHLRVILTAVEHLMGGGVSALTVERVEEVHPVIEDTDRASTSAMGVFAATGLSGRDQEMDCGMIVFGFSS